jgi:citrate lyase beta subunit
MKTTLTQQGLSSTRAGLRKANLAHARAFPGDSPRRQPVHTLYGGAQLFKADAARKLGEVALRTLEEYAPDAEALAKALGLSRTGELHLTVYQRVAEKLRREAVEDLRIDFEDGYGNRPDPEEDGHAVAAGDEVAQGLAKGTLPPFLGIRLKPLNEELFGRSVRTLDLFITRLAERSEGRIPPGFLVTLPKVTVPEQPAALADILALLEAKLRLKKNTLAMELMVETPQAIFNRKGEVALPALVAAGAGRVVGAHFGTYDYTASCNITAAYQTMDHPACTFARQVMQVSLAGTGVQLSDGATNVMPVAPHRAASGKALSAEQRRQNKEVVHRAWKLGYDHIRESLMLGLYQGWDLHPAQLPVRYAAVYAFFLEGLQAASARLEAFVNKAAQATLMGEVFDDAATGQGLLNFFLRGIACGAITEDEALATGLSLEELRSRSFLKILESRKQR